MAAAAVQPPSLPGPPGQPDIAYTPNYENYLARIKRHGFPQNLESKLVWDGKTLAEHYDWNCVLTEDDQKEIDEALNHFKSLKKPLGEISQETFPFLGTNTTMREGMLVSFDVHNIKVETEEAQALEVIADSTIDSLVQRQKTFAAKGVADTLDPSGTRPEGTEEGGVPVHPEGEPDEDIVNLGREHVEHLIRSDPYGGLLHLRSPILSHRIGAPAYTTEKQVFHTDAGDVIALFALGEAAEGGQSFLSSSWHVYNELARTRPDLMSKDLAKTWIRFGKDGRAYSSRTLLHHQPAADGKSERLIIQYARRVFTGYWGLPRSADIPTIAEAQAEALDALHFLAEKSAASLDFHKGDIQYANNLSIFHARGGFVKLNSDDKQPHLIRLWLRDPQNAWETPEALRDRWDRVYSGVTPEKSVFPIEPQIRSASRGESKPEEDITSSAF
ncbi:LOW QUALITY PROTEIN: uncharacterized protein LY79DRAFT_593345 [Colletotrichum navitas]|uniref:TauD/TfdA-like domain-containing protein n=1 Tax=Colletotrichum navitas TaxID=681940 RepID=A0AAD8V058_9PEZI|nr:LOW QUALITY PROTEIN: uncharacterized protein LY79DRAFT_593345 [Colletotrichum navitas]KAK1574422.1 LOW QUALITY PROTEIN: hypothetical protein LY79DRAFT_593345 [Colletotrichum navitas]